MPVPLASDALAADHGLSAEEYADICRRIGRTPNLVELGVFSVMWSEHCSYKSSRVMLRELPTEGPQVLQGPGENAGAVAIDDSLAVVFKMESHNHPSFVEPYQGAATGVGGILRDIFTMGARPVANLNSLRFGSFAHPRTRYLVAGVVAGIGGYGNCVGVPTVGGEIYFDAAYNENILVNAFTLGIVRANRIFRARAAGVGNPVFYVGSKTGRDGIHGASLLASAEFGSETEQKRPTVQVGDPFTEKLLIEACLELMEHDVIVAIQDMGAAGLTSSSVEMAGRGETGILIDLDKVPRREENLSPYEMLLSESQERMLIVARAGAEAEVLRVFAKWDLDAVVIGEVTDDHLFRVRCDGEEVVRLPIEPLAHEAPRYERPHAPPADLDELQRLDLEQVPLPGDYNEALLRLLDSPTIASKRWVFRQYDYVVGSNTLVGPGSDAAVIRVKGTTKALALSVDCNSRYCLLDPYVGAMIAVVEAARNVVCAGGVPLGLTDCLNFGNPEKPEIMWQFREAVRGIRDACTALTVPVVSGNVSFYNETEGRAIPPTPTIAMVGLLSDLSYQTTQWFKSEGDLIVLLGRTREELGGSEYLAVRHGLVRGTPPWIDLAAERQVQQVCRDAIRDGIVRSAHDVSEGGLAVALAECCVTTPGGGWGAEIEMQGEIRPDAWLFGESQSRIVVSLRRRHLNRLRDLAEAMQVPLEVLGEVRGRRLRIGNLIDADITELHHAWAAALPRLMGAQDQGDETRPFS
ncbi:MAG: phosphoribosylformylglycinamidine synthase II [Acidobacteria bacterium RBG_16_68_9]|nr:MAG: phosphoribosylformylglycinamidine synthase II [Acidobacteria bacterium RBG_16_68_9]